MKYFAFLLSVLILGLSCAEVPTVSSLNEIQDGWGYGAPRNIVRDGGSLFLMSDRNVLLVGGIQIGNGGSGNAPTELYNVEEQTWSILSAFPISSDRYEIRAFLDGLVLLDIKLGALWYYSYGLDRWTQVPNPPVNYTSYVKFEMLNYFSGEVLLFGDTNRMSKYNHNSRSWTVLEMSSGYASKAIIFGFLTQNYLFYGYPGSPRIMVYDSSNLSFTHVGDLSRERINPSVTMIGNGLYMIAGGSLADINAVPDDAVPDILNISTLTVSLASRSASFKNARSVSSTLFYLENDEQRMGAVFWGNRRTSMGQEYENSNLIVERYDADKNEWESIGFMAEETAAAIRLADGSFLVLRNNSQVTEIIQEKVLIP